MGYVVSIERSSSRKYHFVFHWQSCKYYCIRIQREGGREKKREEGREGGRVT